MLLKATTVVLWKWFIRTVVAFFGCLLLGMLCVGGIYLYFTPELPSEEDIINAKNTPFQMPLKVYSEDNKLIGLFGDQRRIPLKLDEIPKYFTDALFSIEDSRFYSHFGIDPIGLGRAVKVAITSHGAKQGASTITMQLARELFLDRKKNLTRKVKEAFIALRMEKYLTKDEILEQYINRIFLGNRAYGLGAAAEVYYGKKVDELTLDECALLAGLPRAPSAYNPITSASKAKFRRNTVLKRMFDLKYITKEQFEYSKNVPIHAFLHNPEIEFSAPYVASMVRDFMIKKYGDDALTSGFDVITTINTRLQVLAKRSIQSNIYNYDERHGYKGPVANYGNLSKDDITSKLASVKPIEDLIPAIVAQILDNKAIVIDSKGNTITLDWTGLSWARKFISNDKQGDSPKNVNEILAIGDQIWIRPGNINIDYDVEYADPKMTSKSKVTSDPIIWRLAQVPEIQSAIVALEPNTGAIKAIVGGYSFSLSQFNRITQAKRQLGSNIKPMIYSAAIEKGYTLASLINNTPITKVDPNAGTAWRPKNSPEIYTGPTVLRRGLAQSINVMAIRVLRYAGIKNVVEQLVRFGFNSKELGYNESIALGSPSVAPLQVVTAFNTFNNKGYLVKPYFVKKIIDINNKTIALASPVPHLPDPEPIQFNTDLTQINLEETTEATLPTKIPSDENDMDSDSLQGTALGEKQEQLTQPAIRAISEQTAFLMAECLKSSIWGGSGWQGTSWRAARLIKRHDLSGKTGTTNDVGDTWFSGFSPYITATVWMGFDNPAKKLGKTTSNGDKNQISGAEAGAKSAGPAWNTFMKYALEGVPELPVVPPANIVAVKIDPDTGFLSNKPNAKFEYFKVGTEPDKQESTQHNDIMSIFN